MSNAFDGRITQEGPRNCIFKVTGVLDTSDAIFYPLLNPKDCVNNDQNLTLQGFRVDRMEWSISGPMEIQLYWNSSNPQQIMPISRSGRMEMKGNGGLVPDSTRANYDGSILLNTTGVQAAINNASRVTGQDPPIFNFSLFLEFVKLYKEH